MRAGCPKYSSSSTRAYGDSPSDVRQRTKWSTASSAVPTWLILAFMKPTLLRCDKSKMRFILMSSATSTRKLLTSSLCHSAAEAVLLDEVAAASDDGGGGQGRAGEAEWCEVAEASAGDCS